ncbi:hypothetical protein FGO68_gene3072 [Halteria grandinella]|uniref:Uncharacterized protein n=1 Tax=Halteria grandinella TaxID=5974 RepID=A0A8J8NSB8_HALGN|nr:hypothetical protein FGO68_gene3072 [Halteria grandinella]
MHQVIKRIWQIYILIKEMGRFGSLLEWISIGKYAPKLYFNRKQAQSSILGGIATILFGVAGIVILIIILVDFFSNTNYNVKDESFTVSTPSLYNGIDNECEDGKPCEILTYQQLFTEFQSISVMIARGTKYQDSIQCKDISARLLFNYNVSSDGTTARWKEIGPPIISLEYTADICQIQFGMFNISLYNEFNQTDNAIRYYNSIGSPNIKVQINGTKPDMFAIRIYQLSVEIFSSGRNLYNKVSHNIMGNLVHFTFKYCTYREYTNFIDKFFQRTPTFEYTYFELDQMEDFIDDMTDPDVLDIQFIVQKYGIHQKRYPDTFLMALGKLGGLIVFLRCSLLIEWYHEKLFFRRQKQKLHNERANSKKRDDFVLIQDQTEESIDNNDQVRSSLIDNSSIESEVLFQQVEERFSFERIEYSMKLADSLAVDLRKAKCNYESELIKCHAIIAQQKQEIEKLNSEVQAFPQIMEDKLREQKKAINKANKEEYQKIFAEIDKLREETRMSRFTEVFVEQ